MKTLRNWAFILIVVLIWVASGCAPADTPAIKGETDMSIQLSSTAFSKGSTIPVAYTCDGQDISPPLSWTGVPKGTKSLAMIADDPDAPVGTWVHWVLYEIPPDLNTLAEGVDKSLNVEGVGLQGTNDFRKPGYGGPCPPKGKPHRYYFKLYALDRQLNLEPGATKSQLEKAMQGHILAQGELMGMYGR